MSRGLGAIETAVLKAIRETPTKPTSAIPLTIALYPDEADSVRYSAVRRALASLVRKGHISPLGRKGFRGGRQHYMVTEEKEPYLEREAQIKQSLSAMSGR